MQRQPKLTVFIGSSSEGLGDARKLAQNIENAGHTALLWNQTGLFPPGSYTFEALTSIANTVSAAIFVFGADDETW
jgi:predicted nucleotide-binding protein